MTGIFRSRRVREKFARASLDAGQPRRAAANQYLVASHVSFAEANMRLHTGAAILILLGVIFLPIDLDIAPAAELNVPQTKWWPLLLIVVGVAAILRPRRAL
jgi:Domain of unknown function (DUF5668)